MSRYYPNPPATLVPTDVPCPTCKARPGEPCVMLRRGSPGREAHLARGDRANRKSTNAYAAYVAKCDREWTP